MRTAVQEPLFCLLYQCGHVPSPNSELPCEGYSEGKVVNYLEVIHQTQLNFVIVFRI
jgi:hypothetical protein